MKWLSFARWPKGTCCDDKSCDIHDSKEAAEAATNLLMNEGFGGEGKIFPLYTWTSLSEACIFEQNTNVCLNDLFELLARIKASKLSSIGKMIAKSYVIGAMAVLQKDDQEKIIADIEKMISEHFIK